MSSIDWDGVVLGGGAVRAGKLLLEPARRVALAHMVPGLGRNTTIRLARHNRPGVLGAALLALHELEPSIAQATAKVAERVVLANPVRAER